MLDHTSPKDLRGSSFVRLRTVMAGAVASLAVACGALLGVTDPDLRTDAADGGAVDGGGGRDLDGGNGGAPCDGAGSNCGACEPVDGAGCEGSSSSTTFGDIRQIVAVKNDIYVARSDGIYRVSKVDLRPGDEIVAERISPLADAHLSHDAPSSGRVTVEPKLYAVGIGEKGKKFAASCTVPCHMDSWTTVEASDGATSIVVDGDRLFLVDSVSITEIGDELTPGDAGRVPANIESTKGSRIRSRVRSLYWVRKGGKYVEEYDGLAAPRDYSLSYPLLPSGLDVDVLSKLFPATVAKIAFVAYVLLGESDVAVVSRRAADGTAIDSLMGTQRLEAGGALQELAFAADEKSYYIRSESLIYACPLPPSSTNTAGCVPLQPPAGWNPSASIVSMAVDEANLYYAAVAPSDDGGKVGSITRVPLAALP